MHILTKLIILCITLLATLLNANEILFYEAQSISIELNLYGDAPKFDLPFESYAEINNDLHRAYVTTVSMPIVSVDHWLSNVTEEYFALNKMSVDEFKAEVEKLSREKRRTDTLVYDVRLKSGDEEYAVVIITRDSNVGNWQKGLNLSSAIFEKDPGGNWLRTALDPGHWIYSIPVMNVDSIKQIAGGKSLLLDQHNVMRFISNADTDMLERVPFVEQK